MNEHCPLCGAASLSFMNGDSRRWMFVGCAACDLWHEIRKDDYDLDAGEGENRTKGIQAWIANAERVKQRVLELAGDRR